MIETGIAFFALVVSIIAIIQNVHTNKANNKRLDENENKQELLTERSIRIETDMMFERIRAKKEVFEEHLVELIGAGESEEKTLLLRTTTKFWALFNEVEAFCIRLNDKSVPTNEYVKKEIIPLLIKLSDLQVQCFKILSSYTEKLKLTKIKSPDFGSFKNFDIILKEHLSNSAYTKLKEKRKTARLFF